jgi:hypothetical protein
MQVIAMLNFYSRFWEEVQHSDGQRHLELSLPGREHLSFALSVGGRREWKRWSCKIGGRVAQSILLGCGKVKTLAQGDRDPGITEDAYLEYLQRKRVSPPLVHDSSEGSNELSRKIDPEYKAETSVGLWRRVVDAKGEGFWYW